MENKKVPYISHIRHNEELRKFFVDWDKFPQKLKDYYIKTLLVELKQFKEFESYLETGNIQIID